MFDPLRSSLARLAERAPAPAETGRTTFRLPPRAADALAWLTYRLRTTQKDVLAGLPDVVDDLRTTTLWDRLGASLASGPPAPEAAPRALLAEPTSLESSSPYRSGWADAAPDEIAFSRSSFVPPLPGEAGRQPHPPAHQEPPAGLFDAGPLDARPFDAEASAGDPGARSTYVLPREALDRLTAQADALGLPRDEVVGRALVALRAAVEVREAGRPASLLALRGPVSELADGARRAAAEALGLPPQDPVRVHLERAAAHLADAANALSRPPNSPD